METTKSIGALFAELGLALVAAERYTEAEDILQKALAENPTDMDHAPIYEALGRTYETLMQFERAHETYWRLAGGLMQLERYADAEIILKRILTLVPQDVNALERLGWALFNQNKIAESLNAFLEGVQVQAEHAGFHSGLGANYEQLGDYLQARAEFEYALKLNPENHDALLGLGGVLRELGEFDASLTAFQRLLEIDTTPPWYVYYELALTYEALKDNLAAAQALVEAARRLFAEEALVRAQKLVEHALNLAPAYGEAHLLHGLILYYQSQNQAALAALQRALTLTPSAEVYYRLAEVYHDNDEAEAALAAIDQALALRPNWGDAMAQKGAILRSMGRYEEALEFLDEALAQNPEWAWAHAERGAVLNNLGRVAEAWEAFHAAVTLRPHYFFALAQLAHLLALQERNEEALHFLNRALALEPQNRDLLHLKGLVLYNLDHFEEALAAFDAVLAQDFNHASAAYHRGACLRLLGRLEEAIAALQAAVDLEAANEIPQARTYAELGEALRLANRHREATEAFRRALELEPQYQWALARYGETLRVLQRYPEAREALEQATRLREDDFWALGSLGAIYSILELQRSALTVLDRALTLRPNYTWAWIWKGVVLREANRLADALHALERALELEPQTAWILGEKGLTLRQSKEYARAFFTLNQAVKLDEMYAWGWGQLAIVAYLLGRDIEALSAAERALTQDSNLTWVHQVRSTALERLGRVEEAWKAHAEALRDPQAFQAYLDRGTNYADLLAFERAIADCQEAQRLAPENPEPYNVLAWLYAEHMGTRLEEATALAEQGLALAQRLGDATSIARVEDTLGWVYCKRGMFTEALPYLERAAAFLDEDLIVADHLEFCRQLLEATPPTA